MVWFEFVPRYVHGGNDDFGGLCKGSQFVDRDMLIWTLGRPPEQESGKSGAHSAVSFGRNTGLYTRVYVFHDPHFACG
jgi:hypothetical protein